VVCGQQGRRSFYSVDPIVEEENSVRFYERESIRIFHVCISVCIARSKCDVFTCLLFH
jgi:hypothetical protein